jgi:hypothetical protein
MSQHDVLAATAAQIFTDSAGPPTADPYFYASRLQKAISFLGRYGNREVVEQIGVALHAAHRLGQLSAERAEEEVGQ